MEKRKKSKELSEDLRTKIVEKHGQSQSYKSISRDLDVPVSTVENLPGRGQKRNIYERLQQRIVQMVDKEP